MEYEFSDMEPAAYVPRLSKSPSISRVAYTLQDDRAIISYLLNDKRLDNVGGNCVWKDMAVIRITDHSAQSMKDRFRKYIVPNIVRYAIPQPWIDKILNWKEKKGFIYSGKKKTFKKRPLFDVPVHSRPIVKVKQELPDFDEIFFDAPTTVEPVASTSAEAGRQCSQRGSTAVEPQRHSNRYSMSAPEAPNVYNQHRRTAAEHQKPTNRHGKTAMEPPTQSNQHRSSAAESPIQSGSTAPSTNSHSPRKRLFKELFNSGSFSFSLPTKQRVSDQNKTFKTRGATIIPPSNVPSRTPDTNNHRILRSRADRATISRLAAKSSSTETPHNSDFPSESTTAREAVPFLDASCNSRLTQQSSTQCSDTASSRRRTNYANN